MLWGGGDSHVWFFFVARESGPLLQRCDAGVAGVDGGYRASHYGVGEGTEIARSGLVRHRGRGDRVVGSGGSAADARYGVNVAVLRARGELGIDQAGAG